MFSVYELAILEKLNELKSKKETALFFGIPRTTLREKLEIMENRFGKKLLSQLNDQEGTTLTKQAFNLVEGIKNYSNNLIKENINNVVNFYTTNRFCSFLSEKGILAYLTRLFGIKITLTCDEEESQNADLKLVCYNNGDGKYIQESLVPLEYGIYAHQDYLKEINPDSYPSTETLFLYDIAIFSNKNTRLYPNSLNIPNTLPLEAFNFVYHANNYDYLSHLLNNKQALVVLSKGTFLFGIAQSPEITEVLKEFPIPSLTLFAHVRKTNSSERQRLLKEIASEIRRELLKEFYP